MSLIVNMIDIVHGGPAHAAIIPHETHRFDQVHGHAKARAEPQHGADVPGDFRFEKGYTHSG